MCSTSCRELLLRALWVSKRVVPLLPSFKLEKQRLPPRFSDISAVRFTVQCPRTHTNARPRQEIEKYDILQSLQRLVQPFCQ